MSASKDSNRLVCNFRMIECLKSTVMDVWCQHDFCLEQVGHQKGARKKKDTGQHIIKHGRYLVDDKY